MSSSDSTHLDRQQLARGLEPLFGDLPDDVLAEIAERLETRRLRAGEVLVAQGDPGDSIYIVVNGRLYASVSDAAGDEREVAEIAAGESVGETSLLNRQPHSVTYRALRDSVLVRLSHGAFVELSHTHPGLLWTVARLVTHRLKHARDGSTSDATVRTLAIQFLDDRVDRRAFRQQLCQALRQHGQEIYVDSNEGLRQGITGPEDPRHSEWLNRLEASHRLVVMELDPTVTPWSSLCMRQADRILLVAAATGAPAVTPTERALGECLSAGTRTMSELVLVHDHDAVLPTGTAAWLTGRDLLRHHHLRSGNEGDFGRLSRFMAGKANGLVLAGGGAKAFVHLGVFQALQETGIPIDMAGGTSLGSILAAGVAMDWDPAQLTDNARRAFTHRNPLSDYSFPPLISMMRGKRIEKLLRDFFGEADIEDLWLPYLCVSGDFSAGRMAVHRSGKLWRAIKASISLPGILPPTVIDGHLHVDGGTFDNFPVEPMRSAGAGRIIASDIWTPTRPSIGYEDTPSDWRFFVDRYLLRRRRLKVPHVMTTMFRSSFLASNERRRAAKHGADLYFSSPAGRVGLTHWKKLDEAMAAGYSHAQRRLAEVDPQVLATFGVTPPPTVERELQKAAAAE